MRITALSDTHGKHNEINKIDLPGGDLLIHAGDLSNIGLPHQIQDFCYWFNSIKGYTYKVFIAGNHDFLFENHSKLSSEIVNSYETIRYLEDSEKTIEVDDLSVNIYGSPWQPEFNNWAFNLPHNGDELANVWNDVPENTDILITHGPPKFILDSIETVKDLGCELLRNRVKQIKPKLHIFGHIHSGNGYMFDKNTHFINVCVLNERYEYRYKPKTFDLDLLTNEITFIND